MFDLFVPMLMDKFDFLFVPTLVVVCLIVEYFGTAPFHLNLSINVLP